jgi:hypothetical protein
MSRESQNWFDRRFRGRTELALLPLHIEAQVNLSFEAQPSFLFSQSVSSVCPTKRNALRAFHKEVHLWARKTIRSLPADYLTGENICF